MNKRVLLLTLVVLVVLVGSWLLFGAHMRLPGGRCLDPRLYGPGC